MTTPLDPKKADTKEKKSLPRITIITATYNVEKDLPNLIASIRNQTYKNIQWIVIDGASKDKTLDILNSADDVVSHLVSEPDKGIYDAWNKALDFIDGDWVIFLGADDYLASNIAVSKAAKILNDLPDEIYLAYGQVRQLEKDGSSQMLGQSWEILEKPFYSVMNIPHTGLFQRTSLFGICGKFDPTYRIAGDYKFLLKAIQMNYKPVFLPLKISVMGGEGISTRPEIGIHSLMEATKARKSLSITPVYTLAWCWVYLKAWIKFNIHKYFGEKTMKLSIYLYRFAKSKNKN
ncbi:MAG: glycosyltransferase family 2 protein [Rhodomicrobiaceae bacterium]